MNNTTTCPSCGGTGGKCFSCLGTGEVESFRVCCTCGHWIAACTCRPHSEPITIRAATKHKQHTLGVSQMNNGLWVVRTVSPMGRNMQREVARFEDEDNAYSFAAQAEWASETEWAELRERWGAKGKVKA